MATQPADPALSASTSPSLAVAPAGPTGNPGFHFAPPIVQEAPPAEGLDDGLLDLLAVEICEWTGAACVQPILRRLTATGSAPSQLKMSDDAIYQAIWNTRADLLDPARTYRIRVLAGTGELGHVDVDVVSPSDGPAPGQTDYVRLVPGSTLPISFVIEKGVGARAGTGGGTFTLGGGAVTLVVPAGAVPQDVFLTAVRATSVPAGVVPGTAWDFGPDGIVFSAPVTMTIAYDPANVPSGIDEAELRIHKVVNGALVQQNAGLVDLVNKTVSAEVDGFSVLVIFPRDPEFPEDIEGPVVKSIEVLDPSTGLYGSATALDVSAADATLTMRVHLTDDISGVSLVDVRWISPTGRQYRFPCFTNAPPTTGSDTNGEWVCESVFPRHAESGLWKPDIVWPRDRVNNAPFYAARTNGFCEPSGVYCIADMPQITVSTPTPDVAQPTLSSLGFSLDVQPRAFAPSVSLDVSTGARAVRFGMRAVDLLSGVGNFIPFDNFLVRFTGPSNQFQDFGSCILTQGTNLDGFWECFVIVPAQAEPGVWRVSRLRVPDRAGNGGWAGIFDFQENAAGQLCNPGGDCLVSPTVLVTGTGDGEAPLLQSLNIASVGPELTTSLGLSDNSSGVSRVRLHYQSAVTTQFQECEGVLTGGTTTNGTWNCLITFSQFAARGQWFLNLVDVWDLAGNMRRYTRVGGQLCDFATSTCRDFGPLDLILQ
jgi:hypothetical protein